MIAVTALLPAAAVLSAVTPAVAKLQLRDLGSTGSVVGRLSAWATAGGLAGTFATGFVIVPLVATDVALYALGGLLLLFALVLGSGGAPWSGAVIGLALAALLLGGVAVAVGVPCDAETRYHCARVDPDAQAPERPHAVPREPQALLRRPRRPDPAGVRLRPLDRRRDRRRRAARRGARRRLPRRRRLHAAALPARHPPRSRGRACSRSTTSSSTSRASGSASAPARTFAS